MRASAYLTISIDEFIFFLVVGVSSNELIKRVPVAYLLCFASFQNFCSQIQILFKKVIAFN